MPTERQQICPKCGPVLARKIDALTSGEKMALGLLVLCTCGVGALFAIPFATYRSMKARGWHCPKCGSQIV